MDIEERERIVQRLNHSEDEIAAEYDQEIIKHACDLAIAWWEDQHEDLLLSMRRMMQAILASGRLDRGDGDGDDE